jgi:TnpA family transposase
VGYPNEAERRRLERFPDRIAVEDLRARFALSDCDRVLIFEQRGPENRLGLAVSLSAMRFLGFMPDDIASIPDEALGFVSGQVDAAPHELLAYGTRAQTRSDHLQLALTHLEWRRVDDSDRERLAAWLVERAVEHDPPGNAARSRRRASARSPAAASAGRHARADHRDRARSNAR